MEKIKHYICAILTVDVGAGPAVGAAAVPGRRRRRVAAPEPAAPANSSAQTTAPQKTCARATHIFDGVLI